MSAATTERPPAARKVRQVVKLTKQGQMRALSQALYDASMQDGENTNSGDSLRLLRLASETALDYAQAADTIKPEDLAGRVFDIAALVKSALRVEADQPLPLKCIELIDQAKALLNRLNDGDDCFDDERVIKANALDSVSAFMAGKAMASLLALESMRPNLDTDANLCADYRPGKAQDNYAERFIRCVVEHPELTRGFSAGLSSIMGECMEKMEGNAGSVAAISYDDCHTEHEFDEANPRNHYTEPTADDQLRAYGFGHLVTAAAPSGHSTARMAEMVKSDASLDDPYMALLNARDVLEQAETLDELQEIADFLRGVLILIEHASAPVAIAVGDRRQDQIEPARKALRTATAVLARFRESGPDHGLLHAAEMLMELAERSFTNQHPESAHG